MNKKNNGFSIVELIITISIIIILGAVAVTGMDSIKDKSNNSKVLSDIETLKNGFKLYLEDKEEYPMPKGNLKFYKLDTSYSHSYDDAFGVSGFVTEDTLPNKYINNLPLDPKTGQYYAYAKTKDTQNFEIAGVMFENNIPKSFVSGNWRGEFGPQNLIKEYAGPNFVFNNSLENFPYNPHEKMLVAKISSYSGEVLINGKNFTKNEILNYTLGEGDKISVGTGGTLSLYYSDGSNSMLGDTETKSEIVLANMRFVEENNLFTSIKLALNIGSLWTKASKLSDKSEFEVYTSDSVASVRGTIFGLKKETNASNIVVQEGKVEVKKIILSGENIVDKIRSGADIGTGFTNSGGVMTIENGKSYIEVDLGSPAKGIKIGTTSDSPRSSTGAIDSLPEDTKNKIINNLPELGKNIEIEPIYYDKTKIVLKITPTLRKAKKLVFTSSYGSGSIPNTGLTAWSNTGTLTLTGGSLMTGTSTPTRRGLMPGASTPTRGVPTAGTQANLNGEYKLSFCDENNNCTKELVLNIDPKISYKAQEQFVHSCSPEIDEIYEKLFDRKVFASDCVSLLNNKEFLSKTRPEKEEIIKKGMKGEDCINYQKKYGVLSGDGYENCKPMIVEIAGEKVENLLAGNGFRLVAYAPYNTPGDIELYSTGGILTGITQSQRILNNSSNLSLTSGVSSYITGSSFVEMNNGVKGIFIDNSYNDDYLRYDTQDLNLNSGSGFAIEMSVRGGALKRTTSNYHLFRLTEPEFKLYKNTMYLCGSGPILDFDNGNIGRVITDDNKFYKVISEYIRNGSGYTWNVHMYDGFKKIISREGISSLSGTPGTDLYIGSKPSSTNVSREQWSEQWNDIIDYVKIYKK